MRKQTVDPEDLAQVIRFLRSEQPLAQAVVQQGATKTREAKYHVSRRSGGRRTSRGYTAVGR